MTSRRDPAGPARLAPLTIAGRYLVDRVVGQGGVGSVYAVTDQVTGARLALKRLRADANKRAADLFEREYRTLAGIRHPCIVEVYDYGTDAEGAYYTMELVDGRDLSGSAPVPWRRACAYLRDAASILGLLHARRLLYRDISTRNLLDTASGRLKLIDFGTLADFGPAREVAGTPPYISPEAMRGEALDQRSDLFALGALGYWLVTGTHAFPARILADLPRLWLREPTPASALVRMIGGDLFEVPPPELDEVFAMLLRVNADERIATTAELIDRLNVIADLAPENSAVAVQGYLQSKAFVGRERERRQIADAFAEARVGRGQAHLIEGDAGVGRSRFMQELALSARLDGALVLWADGAIGRRAYSLAENLLAQLYRALGVNMHTLLEPYADVLPLEAPPGGTLSFAGLSQGARAIVDTRARVQNALFGIFASAARDHFISLFIDDLHELDEESRAVLTALAHRARDLRLCLFASVVEHEPKSAVSPAIASLRGAATVVRLDPLRAQETRSLLCSVFGEVMYLDRLSERFHRTAQGNPAHCLELAKFLVESGSARYLEGRWALPAELHLDSLPRSRRAGMQLRIDRLPAPARALAQSMAVPHAASWTIDRAASAAALAAERVQALIALLEREGILRLREDGYVFSQEDVRKKFYGELDPPRRCEIHARLGRALDREAGVHDTALALCACAHLIRAGELHRAYVLLNRSMADLSAGNLAYIGLYSAAFEEVFCLLRDARQNDYALCGPLAMLAVAGYFADRRYALYYGDQAVETLQRTLRLSLARSLAPYIGRKPALFVALGVAGAGFALHRSHCLSLQENVRFLLRAASTLAGTAAICIDSARAGRYAEAIEPFTALGPDHAATIVHAFSALMALEGRDRPAHCVMGLQALIERLAQPGPIHEMTDTDRASYHAGAHMALGVFLVRRDDREGLSVADKLEQFSPLYAMAADHLRANYYAGQGDTQNVRAWRQKLEVHAVQLGSAWQVETWAPVELVSLAMRLNDATELKRAAHELERRAPAVRATAALHSGARARSRLLPRGPGQVCTGHRTREELRPAPVQWLDAHARRLSARTQRTWAA